MSDAQGTKQNHREPPLSAEITLRRFVVKAHGGFTIKLTKKTHSCFRCHSYHIIFLDFYFFPVIVFTVFTDISLVKN